MHMDYSVHNQSSLYNKMTVSQSERCRQIPSKLISSPGNCLLGSLPSTINVVPHVPFLHVVECERLLVLNFKDQKIKSGQNLNGLRTILKHDFGRANRTSCFCPLPFKYSYFQHLTVKIIFIFRTPRNCTLTFQKDITLQIYG